MYFFLSLRAGVAVASLWLLNQSLILYQKVSFFALNCRTRTDLNVLFLAIRRRAVLINSFQLPCFNAPGVSFLIISKSISKPYFFCRVSFSLSSKGMDLKIVGKKLVHEFLVLPFSGASPAELGASPAHDEEFGMGKKRKKGEKFKSH